MNYFTPEGDPALFSCPCGECKQFSTQPTQALLELLNTIREHYGRGITVTSGVRCPAHNTKVHGVIDSEHLTGEGADLLVMNSRERYHLVKAALEVGAPRLGMKEGAVHVGVGPNRPHQVLWTYDR